jgi:AbrB family looped-hinge helix DNA binding protein
MQIPADARKALGLESGTRLMVFADRGAGHLVVAIKPSDEELLELASEAVTERQ